MNTLKISITKGDKSDTVAVASEDRSVSTFQFPKKGPIPHDAVHYFVECALGMTRGFWGTVASGVAPEAVQDMAKQGGHASAKRASTPDGAIVELLQAERIVECFEADFWGAPASAETFRAVVEAACASSFVPAPALSDEQIMRIREAIADFAKAWAAAPAGRRFDFTYPAERARF